MKPRGGKRNQYGTNDWDRREADGRWGEEYYTDRNYYSEEPTETETERSERRSRNSIGQLVEAEVIRFQGIEKNEERNARAENNAENKNDMHHR